MPDDTYEIYAVRYARHEGRRASDNFTVTDPHEAGSAIDFFVWAVVGNRRTILVDTGYDEAAAKRRNRSLLKPVAEGLGAIGIAPDAVETVIATHFHWDHIGNHDLFPNARYHVQDCEMAYATGRCMCHQELRRTFEADDIVAMVRKLYAGRLSFHDGEGAVAPGITVHRIGGHSKGLQCVRVETRRGPVVLASDATHLYAHVEGGRVFPIVYNVAEVLDGYATLRKLAASPAHIIPGHDPLVLARYPAARPGLEGWVARLDLEPKAT